MAKPYSPDIEIDPQTGKGPTTAPTNPEPPPEYHGTTIDEVLDRPSVEYKPRTFDLNIQFSMAVANRADTPEADRIAYQETVLRGVEVAEQLFLREPALKITPTWNWDVPRTGELVSNSLLFKNSSEMNRWLDREFDNIVGEDKTDGAMHVLYVDSLTVENSDDNVFASAFFPHSLRPTTRKHGLVSEFVFTDGDGVAPNPDPHWFDGVLAHELGHVFGLAHTFVRLWGFRKKCNKDYGKQEGSTRLDDGRFNIMDYWIGQTVAGFYLNQCQREQAADQRDLYLTKDGEVNYRKLKGAR